MGLGDMEGIEEHGVEGCGSWGHGGTWRGWRDVGHRDVGWSDMEAWWEMVGTVVYGDVEGCGGDRGTWWDMGTRIGGTWDKGT